jgi:pyruvate kinase
MPPRDPPAEKPLVKTKIVATVGPASARKEQLKALAVTGVDLFRLNFAHGEHDWLEQIVRSVREISEEIGRPIGLLGDLSGPKIRLGELPDDGLCLIEGGRVEFVRKASGGNVPQLTCTYERLIDDVHVGDRVLLADGTVALRVVEKAADRAVCVCEQPGCVRSRQGVNLPGVSLSVSSLTDKDRHDLAFALRHGLDYVGLSFVRRAEDVRELKQLIAGAKTDHPPHVVAKIEKMEAIGDLDRILDEADAVMVARGDLGVEADIAKVPILQKRIIRLCNRRRVPVITATQMLESMTTAEMPTRAEATDVSNAVLDGSDAVMLSGETAIGAHPKRVVAMMSRIAIEAERIVAPHAEPPAGEGERHRALLVTEAVTLGAGMAAKHLEADLIIVATHSGRTALAVSKQRGQIPVIALTDRPEAARRMTLYWGVTPLVTDAVHKSPQDMLEFVVAWGKDAGVLRSGSRVVLVGTSNWSADGHDLMLVHAIP